MERHVVKALEAIFSPLVVNGLSDSEAEVIAVEPASAKRQRAFLTERQEKLAEGDRILQDFIKIAA